MRRLSLLLASVLLLVVATQDVFAIHSTCHLNDCPGICLRNCTSDFTFAPASDEPLEVYLAQASTLCGNLPVEYPQYDELTTCSDAAVNRITRSSVDLAAISVLGVIGADETDLAKSAVFLRALTAALGSETAGKSPLRANGIEWKYKKERPCPASQGYYFPHVACDKADALKLNISMDWQLPNLFTSALMVNAALTTYASFAVPATGNPNNWPVTEQAAVSTLQTLLDTLNSVQFADSYFQERPDRASTGTSKYFDTFSASSAVLVHVLDYALDLFHNGFLKSLSSSTVISIGIIRSAAITHVTKCCDETMKLGLNEPLVDGFRIQWSDTKAASPETLRGTTSFATSAFIAALGGARLATHCKALGNNAPDIVENLMRRSLAKFGLKQPAASSPLQTQGILNTYFDSLDNCTVDVFQTSWLGIATTSVIGVSKEIDTIWQLIRDSDPYKRTMCMTTSSIASWQRGLPNCGSPLPSLGLTVYSAANLLRTRVFQVVPPKPTPVTTTPAPGPNNNNSNGGDGGSSSQWQQPVIGVVCALVVIVAIFLGVRYVRSKAQYRTARLAGGDAATGVEAGYGAVPSATFM